MPSPAILVGVLALVAALAGTAVAGPDASTSALSKKKVKKIAKKQANKAIDAAAPGLTVGNAEQLGGQPPSAYEEPVAYAHIRKAGTVVASESKNFTNANTENRPAASFCLSGLPDFKSVSVTPDYLNDVDEQTDKSAQVGLPGSGFVGGCGGISGLQAEIATVVDSTYMRHGIFVQLFD
jgi:hypothetical protein